MAVTAMTILAAEEAGDVTVKGHDDVVRITFGRSLLQHVIRLAPAAADSLYMQLGAALHGADEPARETAYQEQQVKDAVENGIHAEPGPGWVYYDHHERTP